MIGVGFAIAYYAVPNAGRQSGVKPPCVLVLALPLRIMLYPMQVGNWLYRPHNVLWLCSTVTHGIVIFFF